MGSLPGRDNAIGMMIKCIIRRGHEPSLSSQMDIDTDRHETRQTLNDSSEIPILPIVLDP